MRPLFSVSLAVLLAMGSALPTCAQPPLLQDSLDQSCEQSMAALAPRAHQRHAAVATVIQVDHQRGLLYVKTDIGRVLTFVAPAAIQDLQAGDQILVCMADEGPAEALPQDTTVH
jgi:hypothetical protein